MSLRARGHCFVPQGKSIIFTKENALGKIELVTKLDWCAVHEGYNGVIVPEITNLTEWLRASTEFRPAYPDGCVVRNEMSTYGKVSQQYSGFFCAESIPVLAKKMRDKAVLAF